jgi:Rieske 2Fe-2S family protein
MLFVHPDPNPPSLAEWFGAVDPLLGPHKPEDLVEYPDARQSYEIKANWKIVVENYIDVYHLSHLHSNTLHMYDHARAEYGWKGPHYHFWEPPAPDYAKELEKNLPTPRAIPEPHIGAWVPMLFPGIGLGAGEDSWNIFIITPVGPDLTRVENRTKLANASGWEFQKQEWSSWSFWKDFGGPKYPDSDAIGEDDPMASGDSTAEDIYACEQQQKSLTSPFFEVGPAANGESPVVRHQQAILHFLETQEAGT